MKNLILFFSAIILLSGCRQDVNPTEGHLNNQNDNNISYMTNSVYTDSDIFNTENFNFFGYEHNNALDYALTQLSHEEPLTYNDIEIHTNYYFDNIYEPTSRFKDEVKNITYRSIFDEYSSNPETSLVNSFIMRNGNNYPNIELHLASLDLIINETLTFEGKINAIEELDSIIAHDESLVDDDKAYLLLVNSIARNSISYWNTSLSDGWRTLIDLQIENNPENSAATNEVDWGFVAKADITGFIREFGKGAMTGAIRGAIIGALSSGGTGAVPGAIIGALGWGAVSGARGAAVASGAAVVASLIID